MIMIKVRYDKGEGEDLHNYSNSSEMLNLHLENEMDCFAELRT